MMKPADRRVWILQWVGTRDTAAHRRWRFSVLDSEFVNAYAIATGTRLDARMVGPHHSRSLGADLRALYVRGYAERRCIGLGDLRGLGFPSWTWSYALTPMGHAAAKSLAYRSSANQK